MSRPVKARTDALSHRQVLADPVLVAALDEDERRDAERFIEKWSKPPASEQAASLKREHAPGKQDDEAVAKRSRQK